jgi:hypothetical protein
MSRHVQMQWNLRQVMADRGLFQTSELVPLWPTEASTFHANTSTGW